MTKVEMKAESVEVLNEVLFFVEWKWIQWRSDYKMLYLMTQSSGTSSATLGSDGSSSVWLCVLIVWIKV